MPETNDARRFVRSLESVADVFGVPVSKVRNWRDDDGCPFLAQSPYDVEAIDAWLTKSAEHAIDDTLELRKKKLEAEVRSLEAKQGVFTKDKHFWLAVVALGISVPTAIKTWLGDERSKSDQRKDVNAGSKREIIDSRTGITFVQIPAGEFLMGSKKGYSDEKPVHHVTITQDFLLAKYPVTNAQYRKFVEASRGKVEKPEDWGDRRFNQPEQPVVGVSWHDARAFCQWVGFRLPTEAEWEYACRAGTTTEFSFGDNEELLADFGWYRKNGSGQTHPVGAKKPNRWGLHDMYGSVWEWCVDWFGRYTATAAVDPVGPAVAVGRVIRGGSWRSASEFCRSAYRRALGPAVQLSNLGFRVAAVPPSQRAQQGQSAEPGT